MFYRVGVLYIYRIEEVEVTSVCYISTLVIMKYLFGKISDKE